MFENQIDFMKDHMFQEIEDDRTTHLKSGEEYNLHLHMHDTPESKQFKTANVKTDSGSSFEENRPTSIYQDYTIDGGIPIQQNDDGACFIQVQAESSLGHISQ